MLGLGERQSQYSHRVEGRKTYSTGYEYLHVMIDDHSRLAYAELLDDLTAACAIAFLRRAVEWFAARGVNVRRSDERQRLLLRRPRLRRRASRTQAPPHPHRPYRPRTNGKAERLIKTLLSEWAYARIYGTPQERTRRLPLYLNYHNYRRHHGSLGHQPPASRLNNLVRNYN